MADRNVKVILSLMASGFVAGAKQAEAAASGLLGKVEANRASLDTLSTAGLTAGGALLAGVGLAVKGFADFDKQMSSVKATGADAVANFDALREAAVQAGAETSFSATEAAQGIEELAKAGVSAADILGGGLSGALDLAAAGTLGVGQAAEIAATALTQFGLSGADVPHVADLLAAGAGKAQGEVADLGAALNQSGLVASQFGLSIEETVGGLAAFASAGLLGSDAGTSLKTMLQRLAVQTPAAAKEMERLGISAYDASGNFVGLEGLAGQLQSSMSKLTPEARNAAMAVIFGSDAVRAANVLYEQGASGIAGWTAAVNDQGYAAEVARVKLDNLSGDLEALGGAFESAFIRSGSGVNDFLRGAVQGLTGFVNLVSQLPAPLLTTGAAMAGLAGAALVGAGGFIKLVQAGADLKRAVEDVRTAFPKLDAAIGKVGWKKAALGAAALTAALIAVQVAAAANVRAFDAIKVSADDLGAKLLKAGDAGKTLNEAFTLETQGVLSGVTKEVDGLGGALQRVLRADAGQQFEDLFNGLLTGRSAAEQMRLQFVELDKSLASLASGGNGDKAADMFDRVAEAALAQGIPVEELATLFPDYVAALRGAAGAAGPAATGAELLAGGLDKAAQAAAQAVDDLLALGSAMLAMSGSQIGYEESLDGVTEAVKEYGKAALTAAGEIDISTEKGRGLQSALDSVASSALGVIDNMIKTGASTAEVSAFQQRAAGDFLSSAAAMGVGVEQALLLGQQYGLIPREVVTAVSAPGANLSREETLQLTSALMAVPALTSAQVVAPGARPSKDEVDALVASIGTVPGLTTAQIETLANTYGVEVVKAALASVQDKTVTITTIYKQVGIASSGTNRGAVAGLATGGYIAGPGTGTSDEIPAWLSNGEYVIRAASVAKLGRRRLDWLNMFGDLPKFAEGGQVGRVYYGTPDVLRGYPTGGPAPSSPAGVDVATLRAALSGAQLRITHAGPMRDAFMAELDLTASRMGG